MAGEPRAQRITPYNSRPKYIGMTFTAAVNTANHNNGFTFKRQYNTCFLVGVVFGVFDVALTVSMTK